jgi:hypothetical protein
LAPHLAELAPVGALQGVLAERIVSAAWRLARADRLEAEVLAFRRAENGDLGLALMRDGNGTRSFETVLRYRNAAIAEFLRAQKALQALQAEAKTAAGAGLPAAPGRQPAGTPATRRARPRLARPGAQRNEPEEDRRIKGLAESPSIDRRLKAPDQDLGDTASAPPPASMTQGALHALPSGRRAEASAASA